MISVAVGDILDSRKGTILHQVNCHGVCGGLAGALIEKWPVAFDAYLAVCGTGARKNLGTSLLTKATDDLSICHVFGQDLPGSGTDPVAVEAALRHARQLSLTAPVYAPYRMGCGIGGGNWNKYRQLLQYYFPDVVIVHRKQDVAACQ